MKGTPYRNGNKVFISKKNHVEKIITYIIHHNTLTFTFTYLTYLNDCKFCKKQNKREVKNFLLKLNTAWLRN